ncbi:hypothetical protein KY290_010492 [Solanum tuberosum]|uniref:Leucine-rich repeat-containing N-terminal plant-type domain-containing protein n=1 Tax=Solanum tuberosum TaxID=4113 RepID=A0ABQ7VZZ1_SOLTU|nr:hypothetical protein KY290_010492 [Solanum tuberosum]
MSSWNMSRDCCSWDGVICDEMTGHVIELDLSCNNLAGTIDSNSSLFQLSHLQRLDLSLNNFSNSHISPEFGKFSSLTHLDLSDSNFSGQIPFEISHISKLQSLHLYGRLRLIAHDFKLLGDTALYGIIPETIFHLPNLETLHLWENFQLSGYFPKTKWNSSTSLQKLQLKGLFPESLLKLTRIEDLYLQYNSLNGTIPSGIFSLPSLSRLVLSNNHFSGQFEDFNSNSLILIDLSNNQLQGHLPNSIQNLVNLTDLDLSFNNFHVDANLFSDLKQVSYLSLSYNTIDEKEVNSTLPESLKYLLLAACEVKELEFLRSAKQLSNLDLSNKKLQGRIPDWAWSNWMSLITLNISHNMLTSVDTIPLQIVYTIDLRSNLLQGSLPIPPNSTTFFFISYNYLSEEIPSDICNLTSLVMLDLARNNLRGEIPPCLGKITALQVLDMRHNNLSGNIPTTFSNGSSLSNLNLHGNKLERKIPQSLANCKNLQLLDLGNNNLSGTFPVWLGALPDLLVLSLRSNKLRGPIRTSRIENMFPELRIIDLSYNAFSGNLPSSLFQHLKAMRTIDPSMGAPRYHGDTYYEDSITVATKGFYREIVRILYLYTVIDLSSNKFRGQIPRIMGDLIAVHIMNLSHNGLQGHTPSSFGDLSSVESLDLSGNQLSGELHNWLLLRNDGLRGFPISKSCGDARVLDTNDTLSGLDDEESNSDFQSDFWKGALMGYGSGLCIGLSIIHFMISTGKPIWLARIIIEMEHKLIMGRRTSSEGKGITEEETLITSR